MDKIYQRLLAMVMTAFMVFCLLPVGYAAAEENGTDPIAETTEATNFTEITESAETTESTESTEPKERAGDPLDTAEELKAAVEAGGEVVLEGDIILGEALTVSKDTTITGPYSIIRSDAYPGTLFTVAVGAKLTLDGGVTIDGGNEWVFHEAEYRATLESGKRVNNSEVCYTTYETGAPVAAGVVFNINGELELKNATVENHVGATLFNVPAGAVLTMDGAVIRHNTKNGSSVVASVAGGGLWNIRGNTLIEDNHNHGGNGTLSYMCGTVIMDGGKICGNSGVDNNGSVFMIFGGAAKMVMNGGAVCHNAAIYGTNNGFNCIFYIYANGSTFEMNGGVIEENESTCIPGPCTNGANATVKLNGGTIRNNISYGGYTCQDLTSRSPVTMGEDMVIDGNIRVRHNLVNNGTITGNAQFYNSTFTVSGTGTVGGHIKLNSGANVTIESGTFLGDEFIVPEGAHLTLTGGSYRTFPLDYVAEGYGVRYNAETGLYQVVDKVAAIGNVEYGSVQEAIAAATDGTSIKIIASHEINETIVVDKTVSINMGDNAIYPADGVTPVFHVTKNLIFRGEDGPADDGLIRTAGTIFLVGKEEDGTVTEGSVSIRSGKLVSETNVASVTAGLLVIKDGHFTGGLDCDDAAYQANTAKIEVENGTFVGFDPENNTAEGENTNFCAAGCRSEDNGDNSWTVYLDPVAEVNGVRYSTLEDAVNAATPNSTVTVLRDHEIDVNTLPMYIRKNLTIDMNGKKIGVDYDREMLQYNVYAAIYITGGANVVFTGNGEFYNKNDGLARIAWIQSNCTLTIESGTFISDHPTTMFYTSATNGVSTRKTQLLIRGGEFRQLGKNSGSYDCFNMQDATAGWQRIELTGGTYNEHPKIGHQNSWEVTIPEDCYIRENSDGTWTIHHTVATLTYTQNGETKTLFVSTEGTLDETMPDMRKCLQDMIDEMVAAIPGGAVTDVTLKLYDDVTESIVLPEADYEITVDLNNNTLSGTGSKTIETQVPTKVYGNSQPGYDKNGNPITLRGTVQNTAPSGSAVALRGAGKLTVETAQLQAAGGDALNITGSGDVSVTDSVLLAANGLVIGNTGAVTLSGSTVSAQAVAVFGCDGAKLTVTGGALMAAGEDSAVLKLGQKSGLIVDIAQDTAVSGTILNGFTNREEQTVLCGQDDGTALTGEGFATEDHNDTQVLVAGRIKILEVEELIEDMPDTVQPDDEKTAEQIQAAKDAYDDLTEEEKAGIPDALAEKLDNLLKDLVNYKIIEGDGAEWVKDTETGLTFVANGPYGKFTGIRIDGETVQPQDYEAAAGSTVVTLNASYLQTLTEAEHTISVVYSDGAAEGTFTVKAAPVPETTVSETTEPETTSPETTAPPTTMPSGTTPPVPDGSQPATGDPGIAAFVITMTASALAVVLLIFRKRKISL